MEGPTAVLGSPDGPTACAPHGAGDLLAALADAVEVGYRMYRAAALAHGVPDPGC